MLQFSTNLEQPCTDCHFSEILISKVLSCSSSTLIQTLFLAVCVSAVAHRNNFHLYQENKGQGKRGISFRLAIVAKDFLKFSSLSMLMKQRSLPLCRDFECWKFLAYLLILFSTKLNLIYLLHLMGLRCCPLHLIRKFSVEIFCNISNVDDSGMSLPCFLFISRLKLHSIPLTLKLVK